MNIPCPIHLDFELKPVLAVGAELKNTFCLARGNLAFLSQPIGDLKNLETLEFFKQEVERHKRLLLIEPEIIAYDLHPDYLSTKFAFELSTLNSQLSTLPIQHHHAHIASCMADNDIKEEVIGVAADGMGFGEDGKIWGFEFLIADFHGYKRCAHLKYIPMPGGDHATQEPWRMAVSYLYSACPDNLPPKFTKRWGEDRVSVIVRMIERSINSPLTSSAGRLFDAVSSLLGIRDVVEHEAQAAIELEMTADGQEQGEYDFEVFEEGEVFIIDPGPTISEIVQDINQGTAPSIISAKFHNTVASFILNAAGRIRDKTGIEKVALSGGVFQNRYLLERIKPKLAKGGFIPLLHLRVPPNDGGIALGQAVIAGRKIER